MHILASFIGSNQYKTCSIPPPEVLPHFHCNNAITVLRFPTYKYRNRKSVKKHCRSYKLGIFKSQPQDGMKDKRDTCFLVFR